MIFNHINIVRRNNMFITLGTASEYVSQNLSNVLSLKQWFPNNTQENSDYFRCFAGLYFLIRQLQMGLKCTHGKYINSSVFSSEFYNFESYNIKKFIQENCEIVSKAVILLKTTDLKSQKQNMQISAYHFHVTSKFLYINRSKL